MLTILLRALLTLHVISSISVPSHIHALPITSKPIESTAENLAWQAWIMMPPHQQNLEKSRKVTPKSIFILPNRVKIPAPLGAHDGTSWAIEAESGSGLYAPIDCPPGQRQYESRCIPTLAIDREQLLIQELQILLQNGNGGLDNNNNNNYEYDYDYDADAEDAAANYEPPMMFKGGEPPLFPSSGNYDDAVRLPHEDAPLKFNIFSDNFPTDVEIGQQSESVAIGMTVNSTDPWSLAHLIAQHNGSNVTALAVDAEHVKVESGTTLAATATAVIGKSSSSVALSSSTVPTTFALADIDAIILPAAATHTQRDKSFFKDDSGIQLIATVPHAVDEDYERGDVAITAARPQPPNNMAELLKVDSLLPLHNAAGATTTTSNKANIRSTTLAAPTVIVAQSAATSAQATVEKQAKVTEATAAKATSTQASTATTSKAFIASGSQFFLSSTTADQQSSADIESTTDAMQYAALLTEADRRSSASEDSKEERTRSSTQSEKETIIATGPATSTDDFSMTSLLPAEVTTSFQLDETTIIAEPLPTAMMESLLNSFVASEKPRNQTKNTQIPQNYAVPKKSKVEPVGAMLEIERVRDDDDDDLFSSEATPLPSAQQQVVDAERKNDQHVIDAERNTAAADHVAVAERVASTERIAYDRVGYENVDNEDDDQFYYQQVDSVETTDMLVALVPKSSTEPTTTTTTTTKMSSTTLPEATTSEIDLAAELRAINELVKKGGSGRRQQSGMPLRKKATAVLKAAKIVATTTTTSTTTPMPTDNHLSEQQFEDLIKSTVLSEATSATTTAAAEASTTPIVLVTSARADESLGTTATTTTALALSEFDATTTKIMPSTAASVVSSSAEAAATATLWAKIMPILGFSSVTTTTEIPQTTVASSSEKSSENSSSSILSSGNRSHRNSKITRIDKLSTKNSLSDKHAKKPTTTTTIETITNTSLSTFPNSTKKPVIYENSSTSTSNASNSSFSPFWWLPVGWRLDRATPSNTLSSSNPSTEVPPPAAAPKQQQQQSLLLRFWSAFPGNQLRVKE